MSDKVEYMKGTPSTWEEVEDYIGVSWGNLSPHDHRRRTMAILKDLFEVPKLKIKK